MKGYEDFKKKYDYNYTIFESMFTLHPSHELSVIRKTLGDSFPTKLGECIDNLDGLIKEDSLDYLNSHLFQMTLSSTIDSFDILMKDYIVEVLKADKNIMNKVTISGLDLYELNKLATKEDILESLKEKVIARLYWDNFNDLINLVQKYILQIEHITLSEEHFILLKQAKLIRNQWVHANGIINRDFVDRVGIKGLTTNLGQPFILDHKLFGQLLFNLDTVASALHSHTPEEIDKRVREAMMETLKRFSLLKE